MRLSIITINRNNADGLRRTMESVLRQTCQDFEYIVVDGASTDGSQYVAEQMIESARKLDDNNPVIKYISEPDNGIYNAMNKGIQLASGEYFQFLNSGDQLAADNVVEKMYNALEDKGYPDVLYGDMLKVDSNGKLLRRDKGGSGQCISLNMFYRGCLNHSPAYIRRSLLLKYGLYDESLRICSDWKFYVQALVIGENVDGIWQTASAEHVDMDVTIFDMTGISETNKDLLNTERNMLLRQMIPSGILKDYQMYHTDVEIMRRIHRHPWVYRIVWFMERVLFKFEKWSRV